MSNRPALGLANASCSRLPERAVGAILSREGWMSGRGGETVRKGQPPGTMIKRVFSLRAGAALPGALLLLACAGSGAAEADLSADVAIYGATPAGISGAIAAARMGSTVILIDRNVHIGGLMANGLGATDIKNRGAVGGIFLEYVKAVRAYYVEKYGESSPQVQACNDGYYFEPHVAELLLNRMIEAEPGITLRANLELKRPAMRRGNIESALFGDRAGGPDVTVRAKVFVDATYEGDLAAAAGAPYRLGRESRRDLGEPYAGVLYWNYRTKEYHPEISTGEGDRRIQAYNYRLCLTDDPANQAVLEAPPGYDRREYMILTRDVRSGKVKTYKDAVSIISMPNRKSDTNNHTIPLISTDLPEENYPYPEADWKWRDEFAVRLRNYTLGFLYFCRNDSSLPDWFREQASRWGLAKDEYQDNGNFPRQIYVREARRIDGIYNFTAHDIVLDPGQHRTRLQPDSIACGSYEMDSHPTRKYEPGIPVQEGLLGVFQYRDVYQIPYGVIVPKKVRNLLVTGAISGTHMGFSTLRMEPCWMAMGQAGGTAAHLAARAGIATADVDVATLQTELLAQNAVIMYFDDVAFTDADRAAIQFFGSRMYDSYTFSPAGVLDRATAALWLDLGRRMGAFSRGRKGPHEGFVDVGRGHPAFASIRALQERGIFAAESSAREFRPYEQLTPDDLNRWLEAAGLKPDLAVLAGRPYVRRGEFLTILYTLLSAKGVRE